MGYSSFISDDPNVLITLEKQIGKNVFGCDNNMLNKIFDYDLNKYTSFIIKIPLYCLITKSDHDVKILIHKNLVNNVITHIQGRTTSGKPIYDIVNLKNKVEKDEDFEEYSIDLSNYSLDDSHEQKLLVSHTVLDRIYEFDFNIPTIKETELNNWSKLEDFNNINQLSDRNEYDVRTESLTINPLIFRTRNLKIDNDLCFILIPFKPAFLRIFEDYIKPILKTKFSKIIKADDIYAPNPIIEDIWIQINQARLIIADVTGKNPNVFYELGIAHTLGKDVIIITQNKDDIPFDIQHIRYIYYNDNKDGWKNLEENLLKFIDTILTNINSYYCLIIFTITNLAS